MDKQLKILLSIAIPVAALLIFYTVFTAIKVRKENLAYNITGIIEIVNYDVKGTPIITVNGKEYVLGAGYNFDHKIEKNDSIIKEKGSNRYKLIKHNSSTVLEFRN